MQLFPTDRACYTPRRGARRPVSARIRSMQPLTSFYSEDERGLGREFLDRGYVVREVCDHGALEAIREEVVRLACLHLKCRTPNNPDAFLNNIHEVVAPADLNALRLAIYHGVNAATW